MSKDIRFLWICVIVIAFFIFGSTIYNVTPPQMMNLPIIGIYFLPALLALLLLSKKKVYVYLSAFGVASLVSILGYFIATCREQDFFCTKITIPLMAFMVVSALAVILIIIETIQDVRRKK